MEKNDSRSLTAGTNPSIIWGVGTVSFHFSPRRWKLCHTEMPWSTLRSFVEGWSYESKIKRWLYWVILIVVFWSSKLMVLEFWAKNCWICWFQFNCLFWIGHVTQRYAAWFHMTTAQPRNGKWNQNSIAWMPQLAVECQTQIISSDC